MSWILIIWMTSGSNAVPAIPVRVDRYGVEAECQRAAEVWRATESMLTLGKKVAVCLPGPSAP